MPPAVDRKSCFLINSRDDGIVVGGVWHQGVANMVDGLRITIRGNELSYWIDKRIAEHQALLDPLDERIAKREGDQPFDVRVDDGCGDLKSFGELQAEQRRLRDRIADLSWLRDHVVADELYTLGRGDLRLTGLIAADGSGDTPDIAEAGLFRPSAFESVNVNRRNTAVIDGLKLTMTGGKVRELLDERIRRHQQCAERWQRELARTPAEQTDEHPLLPDHLCENEAERHEWRARVLGFIRDHISPFETYLLGEADLEFGELLPAKPGWLEQEEYEQRTAVGFHLERLVKKVGSVMPCHFGCPMNADETVVQSSKSE